MSRYTTNLIFLCLLVFSFGQSKKEKLDTLSVTKDGGYHYSIRIGADISNLMRIVTDEDYHGIELVGDIRISDNVYLAVEWGQASKRSDESFFNFTSEGEYLRLGVDYNLYKRRFFVENLLYIGFRYSFSNFSQTLNRYQLYNTLQYWSETNILGKNKDLLATHDGLASEWFEIVFGLKAELFSNLYIGFSLRFYKTTSQTEKAYFPNLWIPGYNKVVSENPFSAGFNYTLSYQIPIIKNKKRRVK